MSKFYIRSQDRKTLDTVKRISVRELTSFNANNFNGYEKEKVIGGAVYVNGESFAKYNSLDRALQILDEIQTLLINKKKSKTETELSNRDCVVYELPKE